MLRVFVLSGLTTERCPNTMLIGIFLTRSGAENEQTYQESLNESSGDYHRFYIEEREVRP